VRKSQPTRHVNQCAHDNAPCAYQPFSRSNSRIAVSNRCIAASMCAAISAICSPNASSSTFALVCMKRFYHCVFRLSWIASATIICLCCEHFEPIKHSRRCAQFGARSKLIESDSSACLCALRKMRQQKSKTLWYFFSPAQHRTIDSPHHSLGRSVARSVDQRTENPRVGGSIPAPHQPTTNDSPSPSRAHHLTLDSPRRRSCFIHDVGRAAAIRSSIERAAYASRCVPPAAQQTRSLQSARGCAANSTAPARRASSLPLKHLGGGRLPRLTSLAKHLRQIRANGCVGSDDSAGDVVTVLHAVAIAVVRNV